MRLGDQPADLLAHQRIGHINRLRDQPDALQLAILPASGLDLKHVIRTMVVIDQRNLVALRARQDARGDAGGEIERAHRRIDPRLGLGADVRVPVEHAADGLDRHSRARGDIADIGALAHPASAPARPPNSAANGLPGKMNTGGWPSGAGIVCVPG